MQDKVEVSIRSDVEVSIEVLDDSGNTYDLSTTPIQVDILVGNGTFSAYSYGIEDNSENPNNLNCYYNYEDGNPTELIVTIPKNTFEQTGFMMYRVSVKEESTRFANNEKELWSKTYNSNILFFR